MARWTASAKWAVGPALDGQRDMPLALRLSEGLGVRLCEGADGNEVSVSKRSYLATGECDLGLCSTRRSYELDFVCVLT